MCVCVGMCTQGGGCHSLNLNVTDATPLKQLHHVGKERSHFLDPGLLQELGGRPAPALDGNDFLYGSD